MTKCFRVDYIKLAIDILDPEKTTNFSQIYGGSAIFSQKRNSIIFCGGFSKLQGLSNVWELEIGEKVCL